MRGVDTIIEKYFREIKETTVRNLAYLVEGVMRSGRASVWHAAQAMSEVNGKSFKTNEKRGNRLLQDSNFQIDDTMFRKYTKILFQALRERENLEKGDRIQINVDYTTDNDDFLILMSSIKFGQRAVPLYFSMRLYPKRKNQSDQKKMESSFIKALKHLLPKKYKYTIVADRGFGNQRFAKLCEENGFDFVLRINENLRIERKGKVENLEKYKEKNAKFKARVVAWDKEYSFEIKTKNGSTWFLMMPSESKNGAEKYEQRFSIEKCFQDQKSSGFDIEKCKIKKYDRFKRLYFTMCLAQLLVVIAGEYVETENHPIKKIFPITADLISVFLSSDLNYSDIISLKQSRLCYLF